jgi:hypothetical protein
MWFFWVHNALNAPVKRSAPYTLIRGADWFIENDKSYDIVAQTCVPETEIICIQTVSKPTNWIGATYLETTEGSMKILKEDEKGVCFWRSGWMGVHWLGEGDWSTVERWIKT